MKLGVCYYPEHWPRERWREDAQLMHRAGLTYVRIGEFAWSLMEPAEGSFDWEWLDEAISVLAAENLKVVLCTPTAAPPAWLVEAHPEILPVDAQGQVRRFGSRRHYCSNCMSFRTYTQRIVGEMSTRYGRLKSVVGWQIDNEFGCYDTIRCYCDRCAIAFRDWLKERYGSLDALNQAWGTTFWSQVYMDWEQVAPPILSVAESNPSHVLDYWRFSSDSVREYQQIQVDILREFSPGKFVTHNFMAEFPDLDTFKMAQSLDFVSWDSYPTGYAEKASKSFYLPNEPRPPYAYDVGDPYVTGFCHELTRGMKEKPFWIMEQQCGNINWSEFNTGVRTGAVRLWSWHAFACGAEAVVYFRWRASRFGFEQHHSGLLQHDGSLGVGYQDVSSLTDMGKLVDQIINEPHNSQVALLFDYEDLWAIQLQPHRKDFSYLRHVFRYYRALVELGIQFDIISKSSDLSGYKLVIAPTLFIADEDLANRLSVFVESGGLLTLGVRSGFKTETNLVTELSLPGVFRSLVGYRVTDWHALPPLVSYSLECDVPGMEGSASIWAEALLPDKLEHEGMEILARYLNGPFDGKAALTSSRLGAGRVIYLGWYLSLDQARALLAHLTQKMGIQSLSGLPEGVISIQRGSKSILLNFRDDVVNFEVYGNQVEIPPRDVLVYH
jgi:beta-galactosidase